MNIKRAYRQGIIDTDKHPLFYKGQVVDVISETRDGLYLVQSTVSGNPEFIRKQFIKLNE
jgi:hypothetical protein